MENVYLKQNPQYNFNQTILYPSAVFSSTFLLQQKHNITPSLAIYLHDKMALFKIILSNLPYAQKPK